MRDLAQGCRAPQSGEREGLSLETKQGSWLLASASPTATAVGGGGKIGSSQVGGTLKGDGRPQAPELQTARKVPHNRWHKRLQRGDRCRLNAESVALVREWSHKIRELHTKWVAGMAIF